MGCCLLKFYTVCLVLLGQSGINSLSLDTQLDGNVLSFLNLSEKKHFRKEILNLVFDYENCENFCLAKFPTI